MEYPFVLLDTNLDLNRHRSWCHGISKPQESLVVKSDGSANPVRPFPSSVVWIPLRRSQVRYESDIGAQPGALLYSADVEWQQLEQVLRNVAVIEEKDREERLRLTNTPQIRPTIEEPGSSQSARAWGCNIFFV